MRFVRFRCHWRAALFATLCLLPGLPLHAAPGVRLRQAPPGPVPGPETLSVQVETSGRTSRLAGLEIAAVGRRVPRTFSRHLIGNTEGFDWFVSRHFALKTDLPEAQVLETFVLLELALPQLEAVFGQQGAALADRRMVFVFASSRHALRRAMADDDLHVLNLGGITQEGYWGAYQYAGSSYQNRYIILHELVHLFQYCLAGSTRHCYGFFIEGVADFFSSHVYDPGRRQLTVNVLDRAPMHNHLAAGLAAWHARGRPALSALYAEGATTRGLDVLMTAFLQATPERELKWRLYCNETLCRARHDQSPRQLSDELIAALYGDWPSLDRDFAAWMAARQPTFVLADHGFDQAGETLVSQEPLPGRIARMCFHPPPLSPAVADPFTRDYPRTPSPSTPLATTNAFSLAFSIIPEDQPPGGRLGLQLGGEQPVLGVGVSNGQQIVLATPASNWVCALPPSQPTGAGPAACDVRLDVTPDAARLTLLRGFSPQPLAQGSVPLAPEQFAAAGGVPVELTATAGGFRLVPRFWEDPAPSPFKPARGDARLQPRPMASRFGTPDAAGPIFRALRALGDQAPDTLRIAGHMLLADAAGTTARRRLPEDELNAASFWQGLATAVQDAPAGEPARREALASLADLALDLALVYRDGAREPEARVRLRRPWIGASRGSVSLWLDGLHLQTRAVRGRRKAPADDLLLPLPDALRTGVHTLTARVELEWFGLPLAAWCSLPVNPGIPRWHVVGPFMLPAGVVTNIAFAPEQEPLDLQRLFAAPDGTQMTWRREEVPPGQPLEADQLIHFARRFRRQANFAAAYAAATFASAEATPAVLALGASDGVQVWLNGQCVLTDLRLREWAPGNVRVPIALARGDNTLLIKSLHADGLWFLSGRLEDCAGKPLRGIAYPP